MKVKIHQIIILAAILLFLGLIQPIFSDGVILNTDQPAHFMRIWCLAEHHGWMPNNWCSFANAGVPLGQYYYPPIDGFIALLGKFVGLESAYQFFMVLALLTPAIGAYLLLAERKRKLAGSIAFGFILLQHGSWHAGGFEETLLVGLWPFMMSIGFLLISITLFIRFAERPTNTRLVLAALSTLFFTHPMSLLIGSISYLGLAIYYRKAIITNWRKFALLAGTVLALNAYYLLPLLTKLAYFPARTGHVLSWNNFIIYIFNPIPKYFFILAGTGLLLAFFDKTMRPVLAISIPILLDFLISFNPTLGKLTPLTLGVRIGAYLSLLTFLYAGYAFESIPKLFKTNARTLLVMLAIAIAVFLTYQTYSASAPYSNNIIHSEHEAFGVNRQVYSYLGTLPEGRVLAEETLHNFGQTFLSFTHAHSLIPYYSGKDAISFYPNFFPKDRPLFEAQRYLFGKKPEEYTLIELENITERYNIAYVVTHTPLYQDVFSQISSSRYEIPPYTIFTINRTPSYFTTHNGELLDADYQGTYARAVVDPSPSGADVVLRANSYPNWHTYIDGKRVESEECDLQPCARVDHKSTIEFKYELTGPDILGYTLSLIALIGCAYLWREEYGKHKHHHTRVQRGGEDPPQPEDDSHVHQGTQGHQGSDHSR